MTQQNVLDAFLAEIFSQCLSTVILYIYFSQSEGLSNYQPQKNFSATCATCNTVKMSKASQTLKIKLYMSALR